MKSDEQQRPTSNGEDIAQNRKLCCWLVVPRKFWDFVSILRIVYGNGRNYRSFRITDA